MAGIAVLLGAFGAHILSDRIGSAELSWWKTAVSYHMWHSLAVLSLGLADFPPLRAPAWLLAGGALLFSATLYAMALGAPHWLGSITPFGGLAMIAGWTLLVWRALRTGPLSS